MAEIDARLLVTGASGQLGRRVLTHLLETHRIAGNRIIATTRKPDALTDFAAREVEVRYADFDDATTLAASFAGAERMLLISTDALTSPGQRISQHRAAIQAAEWVGVQHVVYTSAPNPLPDQPLIDDHFWTEQALAGGRLEWTILRDNIYTEALLRSLPAAVISGKLVTATGNGARSYVTREDCARTAAAALASQVGRRILDVTGPSAVTLAEVAAMATELTGRQVTHISVGPEELRMNLMAAKLPPALAGGMVAFDTAVAQGYHAIVTPTVKDLTGAAPLSVRDLLTRERAALVAARPA
jgi:NAD(P)H dehydrogenase (quinone)